MKILSYRRFALWWQLAMDWFQGQFASLASSIDFTPVENKLDEIKSDATANKNEILAAIRDSSVEIRPISSSEIRELFE